MKIKGALIYLWLALFLAPSLKAQIAPKNAPRKTVAESLFRSSQQFWRYSHKNFQLGFEYEKGPDVNVPDTSIAYNRFILQGDHFVFSDVSLALIYHVNAKDKREFVEDYLSDIKSAVNAKGDGGFGLRLGDYNNNFIRLETYGERFGTLNNLIGVDLTSSVLENTVNAFWNKKRDDNTTTTETMTSTPLFDVRTRTKTDNSIDSKDYGFSSWVVVPSNIDLKLGIFYEDAERTTLTAQTVEVWMNGEYRVIPIEGVKNVEESTTFGVSSKLMGPYPDRRATLDLSTFLFQNSSTVFERDTVVVSDSSYTDVFSETSTNTYKDLLFGTGVSYNDAGGKIFLNYDIKDKDVSSNAMLYMVRHLDDLFVSGFLKYFAETEIVLGSMHLTLKPNKTFFDLIIDDEYYSFAERVMNQYRFVEPIRRLDRQSFEDERRKIFAHMNENTVDFSLTYGMGVSASEGSVSLSFNVGNFMGSISREGFDDGLIEASSTIGDVAVKYGPGYISLGTRKDEKAIGEDKTTTRTITVEGGLYF
ncbi:MAG: hypothetical protein H8D38_04850 [DPANN group archaeon]|nr:hypothetical protein [DPANN group archaeon]